jgi:ferredoxin-type protein NapF
LSRRKTSYLKRFPPIGRWVAIFSLAAAITGIPLFILLDPMAIFNGFFAVFSEKLQLAVILSFFGLPVLLLVHLVLPGVWCTKICPMGGLFDILSQLQKWWRKMDLKGKGTASGISFSRRIFLATGTGLFAGWIIPRWINLPEKQLFRPPAALNEKLFNTLCLRCGNCIKACPTKIIKHYTNPDKPVAWMTPEVSFENGGYCLGDCNLCGTVCPSGSISPFPVSAKKELFMASVEIGLEKCLLSDQKECDRCKAVCTYKAIKIVRTESPLIMKPLVDLSLCVGCGACAAICPAETIRMVPYNS